MVIPTSQEAIAARRALLDLAREVHPDNSPTQNPDGTFSMKVNFGEVADGIEGTAGPGQAKLLRILQDVFMRAYRLGKSDAIAHLAPEAEK